MKITALPIIPPEQQYVLELTYDELVYMAAALGVAPPPAMALWYETRKIQKDSERLHGRNGAKIYQQMLVQLGLE